MEYVKVTIPFPNELVKVPGMPVTNSGGTAGPPRIVTIASAASIVLDCESTDEFVVTALEEDIVIEAPTGTPYDGQKIKYSIRDNGTGYQISADAAFDDLTGSFPAGTSAGNWLIVLAIWRAVDSVWQITGVLEQGDLNPDDVLAAANAYADTTRKARVQTLATSANITPDLSLYDKFVRTAQAAPLTLAAPVQAVINDTRFMVVLDTNGIDRNLTINGIYRFAADDAAPPKITAGKTLYLGFEGNEDSGTWDCIAQKEI